MDGVIFLFVFQIFLFGFISADCPEPCNECKEISSGRYQGIWSLIERNSSSCPSMCLYEDIFNGTLMCFCDPGSESYTPCGDQCYGLIKEKGWYGGSHIVPEFKQDNAEQCGRRCCDNERCKIWVWRSHDNMCHLKEDNDLSWHSALGHWSAKRNYRYDLGVDSPDQCLCTSSECALSYNNILTTIPKLYPQFFISFEYKVNQFNIPYKKLHNLIHLTTGGFGHTMGQRIPGVWLYNPVSVYVNFAVDGNGAYAIHTPFPGMQINTWYTIEISQKLDIATSQYKFKVNINGSETTEVTNTTPNPYFSVLVYASDGAFTPVDGSIRNLYINPSQATVPNCA